MRRLLLPALEHGKLLMVHSLGRVEAALSLLYSTGFNAVHPIEPECNDIFDLKKKWAGRLALVGNVPISLLAEGQREEIERLVQFYCVTLAPGGGYVLSSSGTIDNSVPPAKLVAMIRAAHQYGRYGAMGQELQAAA
jgi:uroporphyrinogen decarboxylase